MSVLMFLWVIIIVLGIQAIAVYRYKKLPSQGDKYGEIISHLEINKESQFQQKIKDSWAAQLYFAIAWIFSFLLGWTKSEDKTIQEKLDARSKAFKDVFADNCEIGMHTHSVDKFDDFKGEPMIHTAYRFSVVDLFVEKAIVILENQARPYKFFGVAATVTATLFIFAGMLLASLQSGIAYEVCKATDFDICTKIVETTECNKLHNEVEQETKLDNYKELATQGAVSSAQKDKNISNKNEAIIKALVDRETNLAWKDMTVNFIKSFTFYGLLVLSAVFLQRYGKALLDQSERLLDRRHALRQGRLYLHLNDGKFENVEEMEKAFNWNQAQLNAFANLNTEAQAPWGTVTKEMIHMVPEIAKAMNMANAAKDEKKDDKKEDGKEK
jgi:hypothetical protein